MKDLETLKELPPRSTSEVLSVLERKAKLVGIKPEYELEVVHTCALAIDRCWWNADPICSRQITPRAEEPKRFCWRWTSGRDS